jgi:anti-sigma28 factor (negative regulator of flagellin synthesis)
MGDTDKGDQPVPPPAASGHPEDGARLQSELEGKAPAHGDGSAPDAERREKINHLKQAVADGTYHVNAEEVARKIIDHMLEPKG